MATLEMLALVNILTGKTQPTVAPMWEDTRKKLVPDRDGASVELIRRITAQRRHTARVETALMVVGEHVRGVWEKHDNHYRAINDGELLLWSWLVLVSDEAGIGGEHGIGLSQAATWRHPAFAFCGSGRKQAGDGAAWTAAIASAAKRIKEALLNHADLKWSSESCRRYEMEQEFAGAAFTCVGENATFTFRMLGANARSLIGQAIYYSVMSRESEATGAPAPAPQMCDAAVRFGNNVALWRLTLAFDQLDEASTSVVSRALDAVEAVPATERRSAPAPIKPQS